jgi:hypothetical protein
MSLCPPASSDPKNPCVNCINIEIDNQSGSTYILTQSIGPVCGFNKIILADRTLNPSSNYTKGLYSGTTYTLTVAPSSNLITSPVSKSTIAINPEQSSGLPNEIRKSSPCPQQPTGFCTNSYCNFNRSGMLGWLSLQSGKPQNLAPAKTPLTAPDTTPMTFTIGVDGRIASVDPPSRMTIFGTKLVINLVYNI